MGCLYLLCASVNGYQMGILAGLEGYRSLTYASIPSGLLTIGGIAVGTWYFGLLGAWPACPRRPPCAASSFRCGCGSTCGEQGIRLRFDHLGWERGVLSGLPCRRRRPPCTRCLRLWLANLVLVRQPGGYEQLGFYTAANNIRVLALFVPNILNTVSLSILNNLKGRATSRATIGCSVRACARWRCLAFLAAVVLASCGRLVIGLFGRAVRGASLPAVAAAARHHPGGHQHRPSTSSCNPTRRCGSPS